MLMWINQLNKKKPNGSYWFLQDIRAINQIDQSKHLVVLSSFILPNSIPHDHKWFSVVIKGYLLGLSLSWAKQRSLCLWLGRSLNVDKRTILIDSSALGIHRIT
jgi:hypothetical protein